MPRHARATRIFAPILFLVASAYLDAHAKPLSCPNGDPSKIYVRIPTGHAFALDHNSGEFDKRLEEVKKEGLSNNSASSVGCPSNPLSVKGIGWFESIPNLTQKTQKYSQSDSRTYGKLSIGESPSRRVERRWRTFVDIHEKNCSLHNEKDILENDLVACWSPESGRSDKSSWSVTYMAQQGGYAPPLGNYFVVYCPLPTSPIGKTRFCRFGYELLPNVSLSFSNFKDSEIPGDKLVEFDQILRSAVLDARAPELDLIK